MLSRKAWQRFDFRRAGRRIRHSRNDFLRDVARYVAQILHAWSPAPLVQRKTENFEKKNHSPAYFYSFFQPLNEFRQGQAKESADRPKLDDVQSKVATFHL